MIRKEYPRPQLVRDSWENLNGQWAFEFDDENVGMKEKWYAGNRAFSQKINVPFVYQAELSGINDQSPHDYVWYKRSFQADAAADGKLLLHFGGVDYEADVFINGQHVSKHIGGHTSFSIDITTYLTAETEEQQLVVRVFDPLKDESIPRGKQFWEAESRSIWYTPSTGIWQTVWLERVSSCYLKEIKFTSLFDEGKVNVEAAFNTFETGKLLDYKIEYKGQSVSEGVFRLEEEHLQFSIDLMKQEIFRTNYHNDGWAWTPENPNLFDVQLQLKEQDGQVLDLVNSYFGFRKVHTEQGMVYLNNKPYYQKLVLDQGYWRTGLLTAPKDEDFYKDIQVAKEMGFNGCRKHQKMEDPRFLYWADQLGFLVWGESASPAIYSKASVERQAQEWGEIIARDYNHPCIITWVPINESWGVPNIHNNRQQQHFSQMMYHYIHSIDPTRLVISNDGWSMTETDICAIHNYAHGTAEEGQKYQFFVDTLATQENLLKYTSTPWNIYAQGFSHQGEPMILTEFGGIGFDVSGEPGWGYTSVGNKEDFLLEYKRIMAAVYASKALWGFCYTQLSDVEQEINGLLTYDREPKCELSKIKEINDGYHPARI